MVDGYASIGVQSNPLQRFEPARGCGLGKVLRQVARCAVVVAFRVALAARSSGSARLRPYLPARAVPGFLASPSSPARAGAHQVRFVGSASARGPAGWVWRQLRCGRSLWSNSVFSRTAGDFAVLNQSLLAAAG